jgi:hypothetical protein
MRDSFLVHPDGSAVTAIPGDFSGQAVMRWIRYRGWRLEEEQVEGERVRVRLRFDAEKEAIQFSVSFAG